MPLSKLISIVFHPIFIPITCFYLTFKSFDFIENKIIADFNYISVILIFSTIILPLLSVLLLIKKQKVSSIEMRSQNERSLPIFITSLWMSLGLCALRESLMFSPYLTAQLFGVIVIMLFGAIISKFWKISLHMLAIGGATGIFLALQLIFGGVLYLLLLFIFISVALGVSRIKQKAHQKTQIYTGFFLGMTVEVVTLFILPPLH